MGARVYVSKPIKCHAYIKTRSQTMSSFFCIPNYSPAAIIRNANIRNIILLHAFFQTLSSNLDLEYPAVPDKKCLKNLLPLP